MSARDELADVFTGHPVGFGPTPARLMRGHAQEIADAIISAGYRRGQPKTAAPKFDAGCREEDLIQATLSVAHEQRTANLIAMWANPEAELMDLRTGTRRTCGIGTDVLDDILQQILGRLGVKP